MSEEEKKPVEDIEAKAEETKDASGQYYCGGTTTSVCGQNLMGSRPISPGRCGGTTSSVCGYNISAI